MAKPCPRPWLLVVGSFLPLYAAACADPRDSRDPAEPHAWIVSPENGSLASGLVDVRFDVDVPDGIEVFAFGPEARAITPFEQHPDYVVFDTTTLDNGRQTLLLEVTDESGRVWDDRLDIMVDNPAHRLLRAELDHPVYAPGDTVTLDVTYSESALSVTADFSDADTNFDASRVAVSYEGNSKYRITYDLSDDNQATETTHRIVVKATNPRGKSLERPVSITTRLAPPIPFSVTGGVLVETSTPPVTLVPEGTAPKIKSIRGAKTLVSGAPAELEIAWDQPDDAPASRIFVRAEGYSGYYVVPVSGKEATIRLDLPSFAPGADSGSMNVNLAVVDGTGKAIAWVGEQIKTFFVQSEGTQAALTWDAPVDLDLQVVDPTGTVVDYQHRRAGGGELDLDSNKGCKIDGANAENIAWKPGNEPPGKYLVRVNLYSACGQPGVDYELTLNACGKTTTIEGSFAAAEASDKGANARTETFVVDCTQRVYGAIHYEKLAMGVLEQYRGRSLPVRAVRVADKKVMAQALTDSEGRYDLRFANDGDPRYVVETEATHALPSSQTVAAKVVGLNDEKAHTARSPALDGATDRNHQEILVIAETENSGAFHIIDQMRTGLAWVAANTGKPLGALRIRWSRGQDTPFHTSYFDGKDGLYIQGVRGDQDEFDDSVLLHEFMHFVTHELSFDPPGGPHDGSRTNPALAFSEGIATALGQAVLGHPNYVDWKPNGNARTTSIEALEAPESAATHDYTLTGDVSEHLVALVAWDLFDPVENAEPTDLFDRMHAPVVESLFQYIPGPQFKDRGAAREDLVDFLDGFRCALNRKDKFANLAANDSDLQLLVDERLFPYDFPASPCP